MGHHHNGPVKLVDQYKFEGAGKRFVIRMLVIGLICAIVGLGWMIATEDQVGKYDDHGGSGGGHHSLVQQVPAQLVSDEKKENPKNNEAHGKKEDEHKGDHHGAVDHNKGHAHRPSFEHLPNHPSEEKNLHALHLPHHKPYWLNRVWASILLNGFLFLSVALTALLFYAINYITLGGWYVLIKRVIEAMASYIPIGVATMLLILFGMSSLYEWTDAELVSKDKLLQAKEGYLNVPFFAARMLIAMGIWLFFYYLFRRYSLSEDKVGGMKNYNATVYYSAVFILLFGLSFSMVSWDWIMSIEPHWFSTMFGVYTFSSAFVTSLAILTILVVYLKRAGYLPAVNDNHLHDLGKYVFAFSIFWTYITFCQYMLIWYSNIPEETIYYANRMYTDYRFLFFMVFVINFVFPFLTLMTRDSKRNFEYLAGVCVIVVIGHYLDFFLMIMPGVTAATGTLGLFEIGMFLTFGGLFGYVVLKSLSNMPLIAKKHPYLKESIYHEVM
jgi:hypothetical protein